MLRLTRREVATIKMIEVRRNTSLALITRGTVTDIVVGSPLKKNNFLKKETKWKQQQLRNT